MMEGKTWGNRGSTKREAGVPAWDLNGIGDAEIARPSGAAPPGAEETEHESLTGAAFQVKAGSAARSDAGGPSTGRLANVVASLKVDLQRCPSGSVVASGTARYGGDCAFV